MNTPNGGSNQEVTASEAKMLSSGWSFDTAVIRWIRAHIPAGSTILELGSGASTGVLAKHYRMFSVEHNLEWVGRYDSTYIHAPLVGGRGKCHRGGWYDAEVLKREMPAEYNMLLVDGPPARIPGMGVGPGRGAMLANIDIFRHDIPILLDDTNRAAERKLRDGIAAVLCCGWEEFGQGKRFSVVSKLIVA